MLPAIRESFAEAVFFKPSPIVSRVIFIGTPHRSSALAQRAIGSIGSLLIEQPGKLKAEHDRLLKGNPGAFSEEFTRRVPTSIDMLKPDSKLLQAIDCLTPNRRVRMHSIYGTGRWMPGDGDSDGVVPVSSSKHAGTVSELPVNEKTP